MLADESDAALRRIVFGQGSPPEQIQAASDELQRRSYGPGPADPQPAAGETLDADEEADTESDLVATPVSPPRWSRALLVTVAAAACALGVGGTAAYYEGGDEAATGSGSRVEEAASGPVTSVTSVMNSRNGQVLYQVPTLTPDVDAQDVSRWSAGSPDEQDALPFEIPDLDPASTRHVGQIGDHAGAWIARSLRGEYCGVIALDDGVTASISCANPESFAETGTVVGMNENTMLWNPTSVIISTTEP